MQSEAANVLKPAVPQHRSTGDLPVPLDGLPMVLDVTMLPVISMLKAGSARATAAERA